LSKEAIVKVCVAGKPSSAGGRPHAGSDAQVLVVRAAADLADSWLALFPDIGEYMSADDQIVLEITLVPAQRVTLVAVDNEGTRFPLMSREYESPTMH
jgi:hypothetical protein